MRHGIIMYSFSDNGNPTCPAPPRKGTVIQTVSNSSLGPGGRQTRRHKPKGLPYLGALRDFAKQVDGLPVSRLAFDHWSQDVERLLGFLGSIQKQRQGVGVPGIVRTQLARRAASGDGFLRSVSPSSRLRLLAASALAGLLARAARRCFSAAALSWRSAMTRPRLQCTGPSFGASRYSRRVNRGVLDMSAHKSATCTNGHSETVIIDDAPAVASQHKACAYFLAGYCRKHSCSHRSLPRLNM